MEVLIFDAMERCTEQEVQRMMGQVSDRRREQAMRYKHTFGQFCCLKSWLMLRELIVHRTQSGVDKDLIRMKLRFLYNEHGKPFLADGPFFSISHCKEGIAVVIDDQPVGIDIESVRHAEEELVRRVMNEQERQEMDNRLFTRLWTQKEAIVKAQGTGIESFEQLQGIRYSPHGFQLQTVEKEKYIYSIAYKGN